MEDKMLLDRFDSLTREIGEVKDGIGRIEVRLARQDGLLNGGTRQIARLISWSADIDTMLAERDARISELSHRLDKLEGRP